jgi:uncharacterized protein (TIGR02147 family)
MRNLSPETDYREILRGELETRCARNARYSLRSFARDLSMSPSRLFDVLSGRYGLSRAAAESIADRLGFNRSERSRFGDLVESRHARSGRQRAAARERLSAPASNYSPLTLDGFRAIADWYHYALLELTQVSGFQSDPEWIGRQLGLSPHVVNAAVERLKRLDLLAEEKNGDLRPTTGHSASPDGVPSDAIRKFHSQILEKARDAIVFQSLEERNLSSMVFAFDRKRMPEAAEAIKKFRREFNARFGSGERDAVYCLAIQFFNLQQASQGTKGNDNA